MPGDKRPHIIVLGNEKGGSGKSTTALHLIVALLRQGKTVASFDLDARQGTLTRYVENRRAYVAERDVRLPMPEHESLHRSDADSRREAEAEERALVEAAFARHQAKDFIVCDTPGSDTHLSRLAHTRADTLITPLNDSFVDLDLLARVTRDGKKILGPSIYSQLVWEQRLARAKTGARPIDWIVMRNRLSHTQARNKRDVGTLLQDLARRIGFRLAPGFGERVIFRELFVQGLTLLDLRESGTQLSMSHVAAREEVRALLETIAIPGLAAKVA